VKHISSGGIGQSEGELREDAEDKDGDNWQDDSEEEEKMKDAKKKKEWEDNLTCQVSVLGVLRHIAGEGQKKDESECAIKNSIRTLHFTCVLSTSCSMSISYFSLSGKSCF